MAEETTTETTSEPAVEPAKGSDQDGAGEPQPTEKTFTQSEVNTIAAKEHRKGAATALKGVLEKVGFDDEGQLLKALKAAKPAPEKNEVERRTEKLEAKHAAEVEALQTQNAAMQVEKDRAVIDAMMLDALSGTREPKVSLFAIEQATGNTLAVKNGKVIVADSDGDSVSENPKKWLNDKLKAQEFAYLMKPIGAGSGSRLTEQGNGKPKLDPTVNLNTPGALAATLAEQRGRTQG